MRDAEEIVHAWQLRRDRSTMILSQLRKIRDVYNGDIVLPFAEDTTPAVANMVLMGVDQDAGRIADVVPQMIFPPDKPGQPTSEEKANRRREAVKGWWEDNDLPQQLGQRARHFIAYGSAVSLVKPDLGRAVPRWCVRNPLAAFPSEELTRPGVPEDIITAYNQPFAWLKYNYPEIAMEIDHRGELNDNVQIVLLEYSDADDIALVFAGIDMTWEPGYVSQQWETNTWGGHPRDLIRIPNRIGRALGVTAVRPTLDKRQGKFDQTLGMYGAQAKLAALELVAIERDIFPDTYLISRPNEQARFVKGPFDGRSGEVNIVAGGDIKSERNQPGWMTAGTMDRLERSQRLTGGVPAEYGGESTTNVRTGRRGDSILSAIIDFPLAEAQRAFANSLRAENELAIDIAKAWWGGKEVTYHFFEGKRLRHGTYTPSKLFDGPTHHRVTYPVQGADANTLIVGIGQRIGLGTMSRRTAAELDPLIDDAEFESDRITAEGLHVALLSSVQTAAAEGGLPPRVVGRIMSLIRTGQKELPEAIEMAVSEEEARQAEAQAEAGPEAGGEAAMAQMAAEAMGTPEQIPSVAQGPEGLSNLSGLMTALRKTNTRSAGREALGGTA